MKIPDFYCLNYINCQHYLPEYQPKDCKEQCEKCINTILDHKLEKQKQKSYEKHNQKN